MKSRFNPAQITGMAGPNSLGFGGGVHTERNTMSAAAMAASTSVEKWRLRPRAQSTREPLGNEPSKRVQACDLLGMNNFWWI